MYSFASSPSSDSGWLSSCSNWLEELLKKSDEVVEVGDLDREDRK